MIKNFIFSTLIILTTCFCFADSTIKIKYGVGIDAKKVFDDTFRAIDIGYYTDLEKSVSWALTVGYYGDKSVDLDTWFIGAQFGVELKPLSWMYVDNYFGPCYLNEARGNLSGHLQFCTNSGIGWRDGTGSQVGLNLLHISNAGLSTPNKGVNLIMGNMSFGF